MKIAMRLSGYLIIAALVGFMFYAGVEANGLYETLKGWVTVAIILVLWFVGVFLIKLGK